MSDGIAPAIDKVGEPDPKAPEAKAEAPTMPTAAPESEEVKPDETKVEGAKIPRPVEVMSVPETPVNNRTPAGGTPRPELRLEEEPKEKPVEEAQVILGPGDASDDKEPSENSTEDATNGSSKDAEIKDGPVSEATSDSGSGEKRKLDDEPVASAAATAAVATNGKTPKEEKNGSDERAKKARVENVPARPATNGKNGKAKREKKIVPPAGRTARKTRSQGPVEALGV